MTAQVTASQLAKFHPLSSLNPESLVQIIDKVKVENIEADGILFNKGDNDDKHYYLLEGSIDLVGDSGILKTVEAGSSDALEPLVQIVPRSATARAKTYSTLIVIDSDVLDMILTWEQSGAYQVQELTAGSDEESDDWMLHLLRTEAFHRIPPANIQTIFMKMENIAVKPGDIVINQGDEGDYFYIIKKGRCLVTRSTPNQPKGIKLAELSEGDTFGEEALISDAKRNATITMLTNGMLSRLSKVDFLELLNEPSLEKVNFEEGQQLVDDGTAVWLDIRLPSEFKNLHIKGSTNIPLISLRLKMASLDKDKQYIVYCDTERRSSAASFLLNEFGLSSVVLTDGINNVPEESRTGDN